MLVIKNPRVPDRDAGNSEDGETADKLILKKFGYLLLTLLRPHVTQLPY
jgi:hypothetical protein